MKTNLGIEIFSKGLYSSWCWHKPSRVLFDCGEFLATYMGNFVYGIECVFLSHSHGDHVLGLPSLIGIRNSARGDKFKPLVVFYPKDNYSIDDLATFIYQRNNRLNYDLVFQPIEAGFQFSIDDKRYVEAFDMKHQRNALTLGYVIKEKRSRLKAEFQGQNIPELIKSGTPKDSLNENYIANTFAYCLDSSGFDYKNIEGADIAVMDCTFLDKNDRDDLTHFTLDEARELCETARVKRMIAAHISPRYLDLRNLNCEYVAPNRVLQI